MKKGTFRQLTYKEKLERQKRANKRALERKKTKKVVKKKAVKKKKKKPSMRLLKDKLWTLCKEVVRERDGNRCVICGKEGLEGSGWHTGHFIPRSTCGALLRYDIRNLHSSCYYCNINLGGNGAIYYRELVNKYGDDFVSGIFADKKKYAKDDIHLIRKKIIEYEEIRCWDKDKLFDYTKNYKTKWLSTDGTVSV